MSTQRPRVSVSQEDGRTETRSYYGRPVLKEPVWSWEIPWYFFTGGLAGASSTLAAVARLAGNDRLARRALLLALAGATISPVLLISDLGRPERFYNMLRVFKPTSPMNLGTWILTAFGSAIGVAASSDVLGVFPRLGRSSEGVAALLGPALSTYTAVLVADTSAPVWHEGRRELPLVFAAGSAASAGAAAAILTPPGDAGPARRLAVCGALLEILAVEAMKRRMGEFLAEPYDRNEAGRYDKLAKLFSGAGAAVMGIAGRKRRSAAACGGALILAGAAFQRWSVFRAGFQSARDPKYTVRHQRERLESRPPDERSTEP
jgi:hypothetical protein